MRMTAARKRLPKAATNLSLRADLVQRAREVGLNLSAVLDAALERAVREAEREAWLAENADAIEEYNASAAKRGVFSDDWRRF
jgi:antitoxin CcdA